jgi:hypothetical protein
LAPQDFQDQLTPHDPNISDRSNAPWRDAIRAALVICSILLIVVLPIIYTGCQQARSGYDQDTFHLPAIRQFAREWPKLNFSDYPSATTPGYHVALAAVSRSIGDNPRILKLFGMLFSLGLLATLAMAVGRQAGAAPAILLCLPVVCSLYVISSAAWLLPDNMGWWGVLAVLLFALRREVDGWTYFFGGLFLLAVVLVRQNQVWVLAPLCAAVWIKPHDDKSPANKPNRGAARRLALLLTAAAPAVAALAWFIHLWHGMTPPNQRKYVGGFNPAGATMALAVAGAIGVFYLPVVLSQLPARRIWRVAMPAALVGLLIGVVPVSSYSIEAGRYSGIWNVVRHLPTVGGRSIFIVTLATWGAVIIALWLAMMPARPRWIWFVATLAFGVAQVASHNAFQRYDEPFILIAAALSLAPIARFSPRWTWLGPLALAVILAGITKLSLRS